MARIISLRVSIAKASARNFARSQERGINVPKSLVYYPKLGDLTKGRVKLKLNFSGGPKRCCMHTFF